MSRFKDLPQGRLGRLSRMAKVGARTGVGLLLSRDGTLAAEHAAEVLGSLRGLAAKVGQMASYVDGMVPEAQREVYERALSKLRAAAPASRPEQVVAMVERELGAEIKQLFAVFDPLPMASASIGQVHRARLPDGREVAVKIQHPGIERAVESDLKNAGVIEGMISALGPRALNSKQMYEEIATRFREELDYRLEAERQGAFSALHSGDPDIRIPAVVAERSSRRVLTTELVHGKTLEQAAQSAEAERRHYCEVLWRFVYKGNLIAGMFNADPHPGNYFFGDDGRITFVDFGCVQPIGKERLARTRLLHRAACRKDDAAFRALAAELLETRSGRYEQAALDYARFTFEPLFSSPFRIDRAYVTRVVSRVYELKQHLLRGDSSFTALPPGMVFMNRLQFGFYSVLARLDARVDYVAVEDRIFAEAGL